jgi:hypothetical protein
MAKRLGPNLTRAGVYQRQTKSARTNREIPHARGWVAA